MERRKRKNFLLILTAFCLFALAAGVFLCTPRAEASADSPEEKNAETLRNADPAALAALEKYDSRDYGIVTPVKNQSNDPLCWSYATIAACETSILREGLEGADAATLDLDERNLGWWANNPRTDEFHLIDGDVPEGNGLYSTGGAMEVAGKTFLQWMGPSVQAARDDNSIKNAAPSPYRLEGMYTFDYSVENVKAAVAKYGAVSCSYYFYYGSKIFDYLNNANEAKINPHSSIIVGWDDTVPAEKYRPAPSSRNGGWIVKNSWGTQNIGGYFYLSYDSQIYDIRAFDCTEASEFDHQYFYNGVIKQGVSKMKGTADGVKAAAVYRAQGGTETTSELLTAVNVGIGGEDVGVEISVYKQPKANFNDLYWSETDPEEGELCTSERFTGVGEGYHTFRLKEAVPLENGETFSVVVRAQNAAGDASLYFTEDTKSDNDMTFLLENGLWRNGKRRNVAAHIRAYTADTVRTSPPPVRDVQSAEVTVAAGEYRYNGREIAPDVTVTLGGKTLRKGTDYTLRYENNVFASDEAAVTVVGVAPYTGEKRVTFTIEKAQEPPGIAPLGEIEMTEEMQTLADVELPDGWRWTDESAPLVPRTVRAVCEYVGADAENYAVHTREVTFELVEKAAVPDPEPEPQPDPEPEPEPQPEPKPDTGDTGGGDAGDKGDAGGGSDHTDNTDNGGNADNGNNGNNTDKGDSTDNGNDTDKGNGADGADGADKENGADGADESKKGGLSPAAIAGISLGGAAGVGLIALMVVLLRRRLFRQEYTIICIK